MNMGDWISLAGLMISVIGFSVAIRQLIRVANASGAAQANHTLQVGSDSLTRPFG
jgi:hypothetical protein